MKTPVLYAALLALSASLPSAADSESSAGNEHHTGKKLLVFTGTTVAGAALGGPLGLFAGALSGAYLGENLERAQGLDAVEAEREAAEAQVAKLRAALAETQRRNRTLSATALQGLHFELLFHTAASDLDAEQQQRLGQLAQWLNAHPEWRVKLTGHADPRGRREDNRDLSAARAEAVAAILAARGVEPGRIEWRALGETDSSANPGDLDAYALERRVAVELVPEASIAQNH